MHIFHVYVYNLYTYVFVTCYLVFPFLHMFKLTSSDFIATFLTQSLKTKSPDFDIFCNFLY